MVQAHLVKKRFLLSVWTCSDGCSFQLFPHALVLGTTEKRSATSLSTSPPQKAAKNSVVTPQPPCLQTRLTLCLQLLLTGHLPLALQPASVSSFCTHLRTFTSLLNFGAQKCTKYSKWSCSSAKKSGMITPFDQLVVVHLMVCHCWLWDCCLVSQHAQPISVVLLPSHSWNLYLWKVCSIPGAEHLFLLFFIMLLMIVQHSNPSIPLCKASCPLRVSTAPPTLAPSANLLTVHLTPASRSLIKTVNRTGREPRGVLLSTTLSALPFSQLFQQPSTCSLHSQTCPEGCWEVQCSILFKKTQENYIHHIPSSTRQVKWQNLQAYWSVKTFKREIKLLKKESTLVYLWYAFFSLCLILRNVSF